MVLFGLVEGLIRIVNKYPISVNRNLFSTECFANEDDEEADVRNGAPNIFNSFGQDEIYPQSLISNDNSKTSKPIPRSGQELAKQKNLVQILKKFYYYYDNFKESGFYTGNKSFDELSCAIGFSNHQLDELLSRDKHCIVLFK